MSKKTLIGLISVFFLFAIVFLTKPANSLVMQEPCLWIEDVVYPGWQVAGTHCWQYSVNEYNQWEWIDLGPETYCTIGGTLYCSVYVCKDWRSDCLRGPIEDPDSLNMH